MEKGADVSAKRGALQDTLADNGALQERVAGQALSKADVNRMMAERCACGG